MPRCDRLHSVKLRMLPREAAIFCAQGKDESFCSETLTRMFITHLFTCRRGNTPTALVNRWVQHQCNPVYVIRCI